MQIEDYLSCGWTKIMERADARLGLDLRLEKVDANYPMDSNLPEC